MGPKRSPPGSNIKPQFRTLVSLLKKPRLNALRMVPVLEHLARRVAKKAPCLALVEMGGVQVLRQALAKSVAAKELEMGYYCVKTLEGIVLAGQLPRKSTRLQVLRTVMRFVQWCAGAMDTQEEARDVGHYALSLMSLLLDNTPSGQVGFWLSENSAFFLALCKFTAIGVEDPEDTQQEDTADQNTALKLLIVVLEECAWFVEGTIHSNPHDYVAIALALASQKTVRAAQLLRRTHLSLLVSEIGISYTSTAAGDDKEGVWPSVSLKRKQLTAAINAIVNSESCTGGTSDVAHKSHHKVDKSLSHLITDPAKSIRKLGQSAFQTQLTSAFNARLNTAIPQEDGFPEADYAKAVATKRAWVACCCAGTRNGNGKLTLTYHGQWLVMRFNAVEQGLAYYPRPHCKDDSEPEFTPIEPFSHPEVIGFEYVRVQCAAGLAFMGLGCPALSKPRQDVRYQVLVVGLGTGALPAFLAQCPALDVQVCECDFTVTSVMQSYLPCPKFSITFADAASWMPQLQPPGTAAAVFLDPYDALGHIPARVRTTSFLSACAQALAPTGAIVANVFYGPPGTTAGTALARFALALSRGLQNGPLFAVPVIRRPTNMVLVGLKVTPSTPITPATIIASCDTLLKMILADAEPSPWPWSARELLQDVQRMEVLRLPDGEYSFKLTPISTPSQ